MARSLSTMGLWTQGFGWGPRILPHEGNDLRVPEERVRHGEACYVGPAEGEVEGSKEAENAKKKK